MSAFGGASARTLAVSSPAIPLHLGSPALEPVRLLGREGINSLFEYELLLKTPDGLNLGASQAADFNLDDFIGREICCSIELDGAGTFLPGAVGPSSGRLGASVRQINALITDAALLGQEGRHIQYRLTLRPWLHLATLSTDCKVFQNKTVVQILDELLADYAYSVEKRLYETYPQRDYQTQYNESDFAFFERLCQAWGISYHFEHSESKHRLVLTDAVGAYRKNASAAYQVVDFHPPGWKVDGEYLHLFEPEHHLTSGKYTSRDYDYTRPRADLGMLRADPRPTAQANAEVYQWHSDQGGSHYAQPRAGSAGAGNDPFEEGRFVSLLRMQALRTAGSRARASGNLRAMVPGCTFALRGHPRADANVEHLILETDFVIENVAQDSHDPQQWRIEVEFTAHPTSEPLRPEFTRKKPFSHGPQVALVVGPADQSIWTDELGRIKVQFPWDRVGQKNEHSTCWLRVSSPWAGNQLGGVQLPRIGQEVIVSFIGGDPDLPMCTGRMHNQVNLPPWSLPGQSALSGLRSRELTGQGGGNGAAGRSNHLVLDDTEQKIQAQLRSDHQHSQLSVGHIGRIESNAGRTEDRGEGFELRTDGHGAVRAAKGLYVGTHGRLEGPADGGARTAGVYFNAPSAGTVANFNFALDCTPIAEDNEFAANAGAKEFDFRLGAKQVDGKWLPVDMRESPCDLAQFPADRRKAVDESKPCFYPSEHFKALAFNGSNWRGRGTLLDWTTGEPRLRRRKFSYCLIPDSNHAIALCGNLLVRYVNEPRSDVLPEVMKILKSVEFVDIRSPAERGETGVSK